ncbi:MAG: FkbM family methyltransferase [Pyrinomonadaceae bacterium]
MIRPFVALTERLRGAAARRGSSPAEFMEVERAERIFYLRHLREGMTVFDAGANVGEMTLLFSRFVGDGGRVHAFEASREAFKRLTALCCAASCHNVVLNHLALAEGEGSVRLHVYDEEHLSWSTRARRPLSDYGIKVEPVAVEETPATTVDLYCERNGVERIDLLKIDVEGAELQVLQGAKGMLDAKRVGCVTFEFGQTTFDMSNSPEEIESLLGGFGYRLRNIVEGDPAFPGRASAQEARYSMHVAMP